MSAPLPAGSAARLALALVSLDGVGRVTAHRLLERFPSLDALRATPREQVLLRLKGAPRADRTVAALFDDAWAEGARAGADAQIAALGTRGVRLLAPGDDGWPAGLADLDRADRPLLLHTYGPTTALARPMTALLARPPVAPEVFEDVQALARRTVAGGGALALTFAHGFDVALAKVSGGAAVAVVPAGLSKLTPSLRPAATALVRAGGMLLSPFEMEHGPPTEQRWEHDEREAARVAAALAGRVVALAPDGSPEARAAAWAAAHGREVLQPDGSPMTPDPPSPATP